MRDGVRSCERRPKRAEHERSRERNAGAARVAGRRQGRRARAEGGPRLLRDERRAVRDEAAAADRPVAPHPVREPERLALRPVRLRARREDRPVRPRRLVALPRGRRRPLPRGVPEAFADPGTSATARTSASASPGGAARTTPTWRRSGTARGSGSSRRATSAGSSSAPSGWSGRPHAAQGRGEGLVRGGPEGPRRGAGVLRGAVRAPGGARARAGPVRGARRRRRGPGAGRARSSRAGRS